jgi:hypothetical protein
MAEEGALGIIIPVFYRGKRGFNRPRARRETVAVGFTREEKKR